MPHSLDLKFEPASIKNITGNRAHIYVKSHSVENDYIVITPSCVSFQEFEEQVNRLKDELEKLRKRAKQEFSNSNMKS